MKSSKSRLYNSIRNSFAGSLSQILMIILGFVSQTIFIKTLGATYLGIKGLFIVYGFRDWNGLYLFFLQTISRK